MELLLRLGQDGERIDAQEKGAGFVVVEIEYLAIAAHAQCAHRERRIDVGGLCWSNALQCNGSSVNKRWSSYNRRFRWVAKRPEIPHDAANGSERVPRS